METLKANGTEIRRLRKALKLSQEDVCELSQKHGYPKYTFTDKTYRSAENSKRILKPILESIAFILNCDFKDIIQTDEQVCPYPGLRSFDIGEYELFAGREVWIEKAINIFQRLSFVAVVGASGSGKSSLVKAGICRDLRRSAVNKGDKVPTFIVFKPGLHPIRSFAIQLVACGYNGIIDHEASKKLASQLIEEPYSVIDQLNLNYNQYQLRPIVVVDQWEELYDKRVAPEERQKFLAVIEEVLSKQEYGLIISLRADFLGDFLDHTNAPRLADRFRTGQLQLEPMKRAELRAAIEEPAQFTKLSLQAGLTETILDDAENQPSQLPLIQTALRHLWHVRGKKDSPLTVSDYKNHVGGIAGAIHEHAESAFNRLSDEEKLIAKQTLPLLVSVSLKGRDISRRLPLSSFDDETQVHLLKKLSDEQHWLVQVSSDEDGEYVELGHEALSRHWKTLKGWLAESPAFYAWRDQVNTLRQKWSQSKNNGDLIQGTLLSDSETWLRSSAALISQSEKDFIAVSRGNADRQRRIKAALIAATVVLSVGLATVLGWWQIEARQLNSQLTSKNDELTTLNTELGGKNDALEIASKELSESNAKLADKIVENNKNQSRLLATLSSNLSKAGNTNGAVLAAASALPNKIQPEWPVASEAEEAAIAALSQVRPNLEVAFKGSEVFNYWLDPPSKRVIVLTSGSPEDVGEKKVGPDGVADELFFWNVSLLDGAKKKIIQVPYWNSQNETGGKVPSHLVDVNRNVILLPTIDEAVDDATIDEIDLTSGEVVRSTYLPNFQIETSFEWGLTAEGSWIWLIEENTLQLAKVDGVTNREAKDWSPITCSFDVNATNPIIFSRDLSITSNGDSVMGIVRTVDTGEKVVLTGFLVSGSDPQKCTVQRIGDSKLEFQNNAEATGFALSTFGNDTFVLEPDGDETGFEIWPFEQKSKYWGRNISEANDQTLLAIHPILGNRYVALLSSQDDKIFCALLDKGLNKVGELVLLEGYDNPNLRSISPSGEYLLVTEEGESSGNTQMALRINDGGITAITLPNEFFSSEASGDGKFIFATQQNSVRLFSLERMVEIAVRPSTSLDFLEDGESFIEHKFDAAENYAAFKTANDLGRLLIYDLDQQSIAPHWIPSDAMPLGTKISRLVEGVPDGEGVRLLDSERKVLPGTEATTITYAEENASRDFVFLWDNRGDVWLLSNSDASRKKIGTFAQSPDSTVMKFQNSESFGAAFSNSEGVAVYFHKSQQWRVFGSCQGQSPKVVGVDGNANILLSLDDEAATKFVHAGFREASTNVCSGIWPELLVPLGTGYIASEALSDLLITGDRGEVQIWPGLSKKARAAAVEKGDVPRSLKKVEVLAENHNEEVSDFLLGADRDSAVLIEMSGAAKLTKKGASPLKLEGVWRTTPDKSLAIQTSTNAWAIYSYRDLAKPLYSRESSGTPFFDRSGKYVVVFKDSGIFDVFESRTGAAVGRFFLMLEGVERARLLQEIYPDGPNLSVDEIGGYVLLQSAGSYVRLALIKESGIALGERLLAEVKDFSLFDRGLCKLATVSQFCRE